LFQWKFKNLSQAASNFKYSWDWPTEISEERRFRGREEAGTRDWEEISLRERTLPTEG